MQNYGIRLKVLAASRTSVGWRVLSAIVPVLSTPVLQETATTETLIPHPVVRVLLQVMTFPLARASRPNTPIALGDPMPRLRENSVPGNARI